MFIVLPAEKPWYTISDIIHVNNAPESQSLTGTDVYYQFDDSIHKVTTHDGDIPDTFKVDNGHIVELTNLEKVENGILILNKNQKIDSNGHIVEKSLEELFIEGLADIESINKLRSLKMVMIRDIRDALLNQTDWITSRMAKEDKGISLGLINTSDRKWNDLETASYLLWCKEMADLPSTITIECLDSMMIETINPDNAELFRPCPLDTALTKLPGE